MAAQVLSGTGNVSYTNSTGQNVRVVINFLRTADITATMAWGGGASIDLVSYCTMGRNLAMLDTVDTSLGGIAGQNAFTTQAGGFEGAPTEIALSNGDTFSVTGSTSSANIIYNLLIIPESG